MSFGFGILLGVCITIVFDLLALNFIYFANIDLFFDIMLTNKNRNKLKDFIFRRYL